MTIPDKYNVARNNLGFDEVCIGFNGITLFKLDELDEAQTGYSKSPIGSSLCGEREGDWRKEWIVIGNEPVCGDPIILDTSDPHLPVFYDIHGQGKWEPALIATGIDAFMDAMREIRKLSIGRADPVALSKHPVTEAEQTVVIEKIRLLNGGEDSTTYFWRDMLQDLNEESDQ